jgi:MbtH protein
VPNGELFVGPDAPFAALCVAPHLTPRIVRDAMNDTQDGEDRTIYRVVVNHEEQYSIWPAHRDNPLGWRDAGKTGTKDECLTYVTEVWTDMRPLSLRQAMAATGDAADNPAR